MKIKRDFKKYMMLMVSIVSGLMGCNPDIELDIVNPNQLSTDSFWRTAGDAQQGLTAVYATLPTVHSFGRMGVGIMLIHRGDDVDPFPAANVNDPGTFTASPTQPRIQEFWQELSKTVATANQVIANVPEIEMDETEKAQIIAQAKFLRGFAHFYLFHSFGPYFPLYKNTIQSVEDIQLPAASAAEFYSSMEADFSEASGDLPFKWGASDVGRASQAGAIAMLGKVYLYQGKWAEAAAEFAKLLDRDYTLEGVAYEHNFDEANVNNADSIFEIQYDGNPSGGWGASGGNVWRGQAWESDIAPPGYTSQGSVDVNEWVFDLFMAQTTNGGEEDPRAQASIIWDYPEAKIYQDDFLLNYEPGDFVVRKYLNFKYERAEAEGWAGSLQNWRTIRYADVLLMYAEAENEANGGSPNALARLNEVRQRVDMPDYGSMDQATMRQAIRDERVRELSFEGHRWFDLLRWGIAAETFNNNPERRGNSNATFVVGRHEYLPIPQGDVDSNPNLDQNPAYQ